MTEITFNLWAVFILIGAAQGFFLSIYILTKKENIHSNKWLALLILVISFHLLEYAADITGLTLSYPLFIAITYPLLFCMGPFYYFYCGSLTRKSFKINFKKLLNFIPALAVVIIMLPFYLMPAEEKISFMQGINEGGVIKIPFEQLVFMGAHVLQTSIYIFAAYKLFNRKETEFKNFSSDSHLIKRLTWLKMFSLYLSVYFILYFILVLFLSITNSYQFEADYLMLLMLAVLIYILSYASINNPVVLKNISEPELRKNETRHIDKFPGLKEKLINYMDLQKPYLKSDLKISDLAESLSIPYYQLSQFINEEFSENFYDFINKYRIEEAKRLLTENDFKILAIAYEVGFNSKATFNRVFKKFTSLTPSEYKVKFSSRSNDPSEPSRSEEAFT